jgi:putative aldouronate transport system substrate-binding protein
MRRTALALIILFVLLPAAFVSANGGGESTTAGATPTGASVVTPVGQLPIVTHPVTLTFFAPQDPSIVDMNTNSFTVWFEKRTGEHITWTLAPSSEFTDKLNLVLASGPYPDVILTGTSALGTTNEVKYGTQQGILIPVNDLIDKYAPNLTRFMNETPGMRAALTNIDGKIYGFPGYNSCYHCENAQRMWVNQPWLDKLGLKAPTTTDEFYNMLVAFKRSIPGSIPLTTAISGSWHSNLDGFLMNPFIFASAQDNQDMKLRLSNSTGKIDSIVDKAEYRDGLRYLNKMYVNGLLDPNALTQTNDQLRSLFADSTKDIVGATPTGTMLTAADITKNQGTYARYHAIAPLKGPNGLQQEPFYQDLPISANISVTKASKYPEVVARWVDQFFGFYGNDAYLVPVSRQYGVLDTDWRWGKEGETGLDGKTKAMFEFITIPDQPSQNHAWANAIGPYVFAPGMRDGLPADYSKDLYSSDMVDPLLYQASKKLMEPNRSKDYSVVPLPSIRFTSDETDQIATLQVDLEKYISENYAGFVSGQKSLDSDWESYVSGLNRIGLDQYLKIVNTAYSRQFGKK